MYIGLFKKSLRFFHLIFRCVYLIYVMNINQWYIGRFVQWPPAISRTTSQYHIHKTSHPSLREICLDAVFFRSKRFTIQGVLQETKEMEVWWCKVWATYGGCGNTSQPCCKNFCRVTKLVCDLALSWWNTTPLRLISLRCFCAMASLNFCNCSQ